MGLDHVSAEITGHFRRIVRAVISDNIEIVKFFGIIHIIQILNDIPDDLFFIMSRNKHQKTGFRIMILVILLCFFKSKEAYHNLIDHDKGQEKAAYPRQRLQEYPDKSHLRLLLIRGTGPAHTQNT